MLFLADNADLKSVVISLHFMSAMFKSAGLCQWVTILERQSDIGQANATGPQILVLDVIK